MYVRPLRIPEWPIRPNKRLHHTLLSCICEQPKLVAQQNCGESLKMLLYSGKIYFQGQILDYELRYFSLTNEFLYIFIFLKDGLS
jgi:hypothetical protein